MSDQPSKKVKVSHSSSITLSHHLQDTLASIKSCLTDIQHLITGENQANSEINSNKDCDHDQQWLENEFMMLQHKVNKIKESIVGAKANSNNNVTSVAEHDPNEVFLYDFILFCLILVSLRCLSWLSKLLSPSFSNRQLFYCFHQRAIAFSNCCHQLYLYDFLLSTWIL